MYRAPRDIVRMLESACDDEDQNVDRHQIDQKHVAAPG